MNASALAARLFMTVSLSLGFVAPTFALYHTPQRGETEVKAEKQEIRQEKKEEVKAKVESVKSKPRGKSEAAKAKAQCLKSANSTHVKAVQLANTEYRNTAKAALDLLKTIPKTATPAERKAAQETYRTSIKAAAGKRQEVKKAVVTALQSAKQACRTQ